MKKGGFFVLALWVLILSIGFASAEILIGQVNMLYSKGDNFNLDMTVVPSVDSKGFLEAKIICYSVISGEDVSNILNNSADGSNETNESAAAGVEEPIREPYGEVQVYKSPQIIKKGERRVVSLSATLDSFFLGDLAGECLIRANYGNDVADSQVFGVSDYISVDMDINQYAFNPGESINVSGTAIKKNGNPLDGFVSLVIAGLGINASGISSSGQFSFFVNIPQNAPAGEYSITASAYEKDGFGDITNSGDAGESLRINQIVRKVGLALSSQTLIPGEELVYTILLFDQAGNEALEDVGIKIYNAEDEIVIEGIVKSGVAGSFMTEPNFSSGYWTIEALNSEHKIRKAFFVSELEKALFVLTNGSLTITNVGNVLYDKPVEISIGETKNVKNVRLSVGESAVFQLSAPDGEYALSVNDGQTNESLGIVSLTGMAISVREIGSIKLFRGAMLWVWGGLIFAILLVIAWFYIKHRRKNFFGTDNKGIGEAGKPAEQVGNSGGSISGGRREEASIVALKIKNMPQLEGSNEEGGALNSVDRALLGARNFRAKIYVDGDYRIIIFSPILTKELDNNVRAIKAAQEISNILSNHNAKYSQKIDFGIGVNSGEMIVESENGKFKFTSLGSSISGAKKSASESNIDVLMSEELHRKVVGKVKSTKMPVGSSWKVRSVIDREKYSGFINRTNRGQGNVLDGGK